MGKITTLLCSLLVVALIPHVWAIGDGDRVNLSITPIKKEFTLDPGTISTGSVTLYNNSDIPYPAQMGAEDCTSSNQFGTPICTPHSGTGHPLYLSTWIEFASTGAFSIAPHSSRAMLYTIRVPLGAQPGGHYGGLIFRNLNPPTTGTIGMKRQIQSLILVTVTGDMIVNPEFGSIQVQGNGGIAGSTVSPYTALLDFGHTGSVVEKIKKTGSQFMMLFSDPQVQKDISDIFNPFWEIPELNSAGIGNDIPSHTVGLTPIVSLGIPVENKGTVHILPTGKITLYDTDGKQLLGIGKEYIKNENGAPIGEMVVDYMPINPEGGVALPNSTRLYETNWFGFAHETISADHSVSVSYESPAEYYSRRAREDTSYILPWEKLVVKHTNKQLMAKVYVSYINPLNHKNIENTTDVPVSVEYDEIARVFNTGILTPIILLGLLSWWIIIWRRRRYLYHEIVDDEITVLEQAHASLTNMVTENKKAKTTTKKKNTVTKTEEIPKNSIVKKNPSRTTRTKKVSGEHI